MATATPPPTTSLLDISERIRAQIAHAQHDGVMDLSKTFLGRKGVILAAQTAAADPNCHELILRDHQLSSETLRLVLHQLEGASHIHCLDLGNNPQITHAGGRDLSLFVRCNPNIVSLQIDGTSLSVAQVKTIVDRVEHNIRLTEEERAAVIQHNRNLRAVHCEQLQNRSRYRLTVSNVRLLHFLSQNDEPLPPFPSATVTPMGGALSMREMLMSTSSSQQRSVASSSAHSVDDVSSRRDSVTSVGTAHSRSSDLHHHDRPKTELHALALLSEVIGGGYEKCDGKTPAGGLSTGAKRLVPWGGRGGREEGPLLSSGGTPQQASSLWRLSDDSSRLSASPAVAAREDPEGSSMDDEADTGGTAELEEGEG